MTWFKVDDHLHSHRKAMRAGTEAMGLWVLAGSWSGAEESDGWVPSYVLTRLAGPDGERLAEQLVRAGLWDTDTVDAEDGFRFRGWDEYQPTRERLEAKRADQRERMRRARSQGGDVRAHGARSEDAVTPTPTRPDPTKNNTSRAAALNETDAATFADFWSVYPRKAGKDAAAKAYAKALRSTDAETIAKGLANATDVWRAAGTEARFIPHPATWLNQGRWADEHPHLPGTDAQPQRATRTLAQCDGSACPGSQHEWTDRYGRQTYVCQGA